jgi:hypothetical protein
MAIFQRTYVLASTPFPLVQPQLTPLPPVGIHVTYVEFYRRPVKPGEIEPLFLILPRMSYQDGSLNVVAEAEITDLPAGLGRGATIEVQKTIDAGSTFFTLLLPNVVPRVGTVEAITTVGLTSRTVGPDAPVHPLQSPVFGAVPMHGTYAEAQGPEPPAVGAPRRAAAKRKRK